MSEVSLLCIGHCCHDRTKSGYILGGTASYASLIGKELAHNTSIITSVGDDFLFLDKFISRGIGFYNICSNDTTEFENIYASDRRTQYMYKRAETIGVHDIRESHANANVVFIGTIANEVDFTVPSKFENSLVVGALQGSMRTWDKNGLITTSEMEYPRLRRFDIIILSKDDLHGINNALDDIRKFVPHVVITDGKHGATIYKDQKKLFFPSFPTREVDATGAGDTFAIAYSLEFYKTNDVSKAAIYAHCAASIIIEQEGLSKIPSDQEIRNRVSTYMSRIS